MGNHKIDDQGNYLKFPGYTVVSKIQLDSPNPWQALFDSLSENEKIKGKFALLPLRSWHMTAINLFTQNDVTTQGNDWDDTVRKNEPFFIALAASLEEAAFEPKINYRDLILEGVIQLEFLLDEETTQKIREVAKRHACEGLISTPPHITLAYQYRHLTPTESSTLETELRLIFQTHFGNTEMTLEPPKLCYFEDMTDFRPWQKQHASATTYPGNFLHSATDTHPPAAAEDDPQKKPG